MYLFFRKIFFLLPAEKAHYLAMNLLKTACSLGLGGWFQRVFTPKKQAPVSAFGLVFQNAVGLAAGFDKNARYLRELENLGFGSVEIGTVTPLPQEGNPKPRLFRLPADEALINRMGFNNDGMDVIAGRLQQWRQKNPKSKLIVGGNIGKNKVTANEEAWLDYEKCFRTLYNYVDYFVVNVSSPNTPGLRALQEKDSLHRILTRLQTIRNEMTPEGQLHRPILLKIAPDLELSALDEVVDLAMEIQLDGLVIANTTIDRTNLKTAPAVVEAIGAGGLSGKPLTQRATRLLAHVHTRTEGKLPLIGSGGIFTAEDAKEKMEAGATLVQVWTGFIYVGPGIVRRIVDKLIG
jgi:dihydroorotate dehydrogenase